MEIIQSFVAELEELLVHLRNGFYTRAHEMVELIDGRQRVEVPGNFPEVTTSIQQVTDLRREAAHQVPFEALDKQALLDRLDGLRESIVLPQR